MDLQMKPLTRSKSQNSCFTSELRHHRVDPFVLSEFVSSSLRVPLFHRVSDAEGQATITEVTTRPLTQDLLSHDVSSTDQIKEDGCQCPKPVVVFLQL